MKLQIILSAEAAPELRQGYELDLEAGPVVLGRGPESPIQLEGTKLSRDHMAFHAIDGVLTLTDLSSNGVWLNGQPLPKKTPVLVGPLDEVRIAGYTMTARLLIPPPEPPRPEPQRIEPRTAVVPLPIPPPVAPPLLAPAPAWWKFDGIERWTLILAAVAILLIVLYRMA